MHNAKSIELKDLPKLVSKLMRAMEAGADPVTITRDGKAIAILRSGKDIQAGREGGD